MYVYDVGTRVPFTRDNPFYQTTPSAIDAGVRAFCLKLGGLEAVHVPVCPAPGAETGFCFANVEAQIARFGGRQAFGWAIWKSRVVLLAEFHSIWIPPSGEAVDPTPAAEGESSIVRVEDPSYPADFDFRDRPANRSMNIVDVRDPAEVAEKIAALPPSRRAYEEKRAAQRGVDLATHIGSKASPSELSTAVDELIRYRGIVERLVLAHASRYLAQDPKAFLIAQSRIIQLETRIERLLAKPDRE